MNTSPTEPSLAPPGAGIPTIERWVGGVALAWKRWRGTPQRLVADFDRERRAIADLYRGRDEQTLSQRVLIPRLPGLEDSSRFWSVYMTLDHLAIVNELIAYAIGELTKGRVPPAGGGTAAVKPRVVSGAAVMDAYETSCDRIAALATEPVELRTRQKYPHPWFGPLDGLGWYAMASTHMGIHRAQIRSILSQIAAKRVGSRAAQSN